MIIAALRRFTVFVAPFGALLACGEITTRTGSPPPLIEAVSPGHSPLAGGRAITVTGSGFLDNEAGDNTVVIGDRVASQVTVVDDNTLMFTTPAGTAPNVPLDVTVFNDNGFAVIAKALVYNRLPTIAAVDPAFSNGDGDATITLTGAGFLDFDAGETSVAFGRSAARNIQVIDDTTLIVQTGPALDTLFELVDVSIENANGEAALPSAFRYTKRGFLAATNRQHPTMPNTLWYVDPQTAEQVLLAPLDNQISRMALSPDGTLYGVGREGASSSIHGLYEIDPITGSTSRRGILTSNDFELERAIGLTFLGSTLYGWSRSPDQLMTIDTETGRCTFVGSAQTSVSGGVGLAPFNATSLLHANLFSGALSVVDISTSTLTAGPTLNGGSVRVHGFEMLNSELYAIRLSSLRAQADLVRINIATGDLTQIGPLEDRTTGLVQTPPLF